MNYDFVDDELNKDDDPTLYEEDGYDADFGEYYEDDEEEGDYYDITKEI